MTGRHAPKDGRREIFRKRIPQDLLSIAPNFATTFHFPGNYGEDEHNPEVNPTHEVKFSLGTRHPKLLEERSVLAHQQFEALKARMRGQQAGLEQFQLVAYAKLIFDFYGEVVSDPRWKVDSISTLHSFHTKSNEVTLGRDYDDRTDHHRYRGILPFADTESYKEFLYNIAVFDIKYMEPLYDLPEMDETDPSKEAIFYRTAAITRWWLALKKLVLTDVDIERLMIEVERVRSISKYVGFMAVGTATAHSTIPALTQLITPSRDHISIKTVFDKWQAERKAEYGTVRLWGPIIDKFDNFLMSKDVSSITRNDCIGWKDQLLRDGLSANNIKESYLKVASVIVGYAHRNNLVSINPLKEAIIKLPQSSKTDYAPYTDADISIILNAASEFEFAHRFRWISWILVGTGARVAEITQLGADQIIQENGIWLFNIRSSSDGGSVKTKQSNRKIPIHSHLLSNGFIEYIATKHGPLFYRPKGIAVASKHPSSSVASVHGEWIKSLAERGIDFTGKRANHSIRKWFSTHQLELDVKESITARIQGHKIPGERNTYIGKDMTLAMQAAIERMDLNSLWKQRIGT
ncbi:MAG: hypothetical protein ACRYGP_22170 [Janthinobacterium lividum]